MSRSNRRCLVIPKLDEPLHPPLVLEMIERTYGYLVRGADDAFRSRLDAFAASRDERNELAR